MVWLNGYNLGRYWKIGPQQTMYVPGAWLKAGKNEIIVLDVDKQEALTISGLSKPILDKVKPDESLLHRAKGQELKLTGEVPVMSSSFSKGEGWQDISFGKPVQGRYLCLEATSAQNEKDALASIAELELTAEDGNSLSRLKWKVIYADSEEITAANNAADKVYDQQESTFWQTQSVGAKPSYPHQIVIDLGEVVRVKGFRYLPRSDKKTGGMIKDFRIFLKREPFTF